ncbi:hypothetical protein, partial [Mycoplasma todarodis]
NTAKATTKAAQAKLDANTKTISDLDKANKAATTALNTAKATTKDAHAKLDANANLINDLKLTIFAIKEMLASVANIIEANSHSTEVVEKYRKDWEAAIKRSKNIKVELKSKTIIEINSEAKKIIGGINSYSNDLNNSIANMY